jgi:hypothetical protein
MQSRSQRPTSGATSSGAQPAIRLDQPGYLYGQSDQKQQERQMQPQVSQMSAVNHVGLYPRHEPYTQYTNAVPPYAPPTHFRPSWSSTERQLSAIQPATATQDFSLVPQFESQHRQHPRQRVDASGRAQHQIHEKQQQTGQRSEVGISVHHPPSGNGVLPNNIATTSNPTITGYHKQTGQRSEMEIAIHRPHSGNGVIPNNSATASNTTTMKYHMPCTF